MWSTERLADLEDRIDREVQGADFVQRLAIQLEDADEATRLLAFEARLLLLLFPMNLTVGYKLDLLARQPAPIPPIPERVASLRSAFAHGIGSTGQRFVIRPDRQVLFILGAARRLKERRVLPTTDAALLSQTFSGLSTENEPARHILLHLLAPDSFERIASGVDKSAIARALSEEGDPEDIDARLLAIRRRAEGVADGAPLDFYEFPLHNRWKALAGRPVLAIYVGSQSRENFEQSWSSHHRWAFKSESGATKAAAAGDVVVFAMEVPGGPRQSTTDWQSRAAQRLFVGTVATPVSKDTAPFWPEDRTETTFPYGFTYDPVSDLHDVELGPEGRLSPELSEALRAAGAGNRPVRLVTDESSLLPALEPTKDIVTAPAPAAELQDVAGAFVEAVDKAHLRFGDPELSRTFLAAVTAKPFAILAGLSGSGKTQLAKVLGEWLSAPGVDRYTLEPVRPDWTTPEPVLGYPLSKGDRWYAPAALQRILAARDEPDAIHLLVLDEMNLAHVEQYFADVLSGIESREPVVPNLRMNLDGDWVLDPSGPARIPLPPNLVLIGTVNVDETTYAFSPKVLDRAFVFEFRVDTAHLSRDLQPIEVPPRAGAGHIAALLAVMSDRGWHKSHAANHEEAVFDALRATHTALTAIDFAFGHRVVNESLRFTAVAAALGIVQTTTVMDVLHVSKILPRLHGPRRMLETTLTSMRASALSNNWNRTARKIGAMERTGAATQYVSFMG